MPEPWENQTKTERKGHMTTSRMFHTNSVIEMVAQLDRELAEGSLMEYASLMWEVLEPGRVMKTGWAVQAICEHLEAITRGEIQKVLINVPPGMMKSMLVNVFWPSWEWGPLNRPSLRYISASYSQDLTIRDNRRARQLIESDRYKYHWGGRFAISADQDAKVRYDNDKTGFRIATSVGGLSTGERGDRFIIDDPHNVKTAESEKKLDEVAQWLTEVVPSRVNDLNDSAFVIIMQRVHERDAAGVIIGAADDLGYVHLELPMEFEPDRRCSTAVKSVTNNGITDTFQDPRSEDGELLFPERFDERGVVGLKKQLSVWGGDYAIAGQLQQRPAPRGGGMFKEAATGEPIELSDVPPGGEEVRAWDIAGSERKKSPYTASVRLRKVRDMFYVMHVSRERKEIEAAENHIIETAQADYDNRGDILHSLPQDPGSAGKSQKMHMGGSFSKNVPGLRFKITPETGSKEDRAVGVASQWNNGNIKLVKGSWNKAFINELKTFPRGAYKDQMDALSRAYSELIVHRGMLKPARSRVYGPDGEIDAPVEEVEGNT